MAESLNKLVIHPAFRKTVSEINSLNISLPMQPSQISMDLQTLAFPPNGELVTAMEEISALNLNPERGQELFANDQTLAAYDESINKFAGLEGMAYATSHSIVILAKEDFLPINLLTLYFYSRAKKLTESASHIKYSQDPDADSKRDYIVDKVEFLQSNVPKNTLLFIDGPLIGGNMSSLMIKSMKTFLDNDIIPIFFVKNSSSNLVTDNMAKLSQQYNSDMHWAFKNLKKGQRTNFFKYVDKYNPSNAKIFCYLKGFNASPQRIEFHSSVFQKYKDRVSDIMDLIYYLLLVQGDIRNPQIRPIAIAEKYARETLGLIDLNFMMRGAGFTPTMNQERFAW